MEAFELLNPNLQKVIYHSLKWQKFRPMQELAIKLLAQRDVDIVISAPTAGGKTEAVFLPLISKCMDTLTDEFNIMYVSPLKSLLNDQLRRIQELCRFSNINVTLWHGDANTSQKQKFKKSPKGILFITPESLESFLNKPENNPEKIFRNTKYVVIDEIHTFVESTRGCQLRSLLNRIQNIIGNRIYINGLSATINAPSDVTTWINPKNGSEVLSIIDDTKGNIFISHRDVTKKVPYENITAPVDFNIEEYRKHNVLGECISEFPFWGEVKLYNHNNFLYKDELPLDIATDLFSRVIGKKTLVFANSKHKLDLGFASLKKLCQEYKANLCIAMHHASLTKELRLQAESLIKNEENVCILCTSTLELGIDIGNIDKVIFLDIPFTVSSFLQRIGRSGRRTGSKKDFCFLVNLSIQSENEQELLSESNAIKDIQPKVFALAAMLSLAKENWVEPLNGCKRDASTFLQQILSFIARFRETTIPQIYKNIVEIAFNNYFSKGDFVEILKYLYSEPIGLITQNKNGVISLTRKGERFCESLDFNITFEAEKLIDIKVGIKCIGSINEKMANVLDEKSVFYFLGCHWQVISITDEAIYVEEVKNFAESKVIYSSDFNGYIANNSKIISRIQEFFNNQIFEEFFSFVFDDKTKSLIKHQINLVRELNCNEQILLVWANAKIVNTLKLFLKEQRCDYEFIVKDFMIAVQNNNSDLSDREFIISNLKALDLSELYLKRYLSEMQPNLLRTNKYDYLLPLYIVTREYIEKNFDIEGTITYIESL